MKKAPKDKERILECGGSPPLSSAKGIFRMLDKRNF